MTNPGNSPESPKQGFKITLMQGLIGAISLAGTTAIPLLVQRALNPPTSTSSPAQSTPAQIQPVQVNSTTTPAQELSGTVTQNDDSQGKGKKKKRD